MGSALRTKACKRIWRLRELWSVSALGQLCKYAAQPFLIPRSESYNNTKRGQLIYRLALAGLKQTAGAYHTHKLTTKLEGQHEHPTNSESLHC